MLGRHHSMCAHHNGTPRVLCAGGQDERQSEKRRSVHRRKYIRAGGEMRECNLDAADVTSAANVMLAVGGGPHLHVTL